MSYYIPLARRLLIHIYSFSKRLRGECTEKMFCAREGIYYSIRVQQRKMVWLRKDIALVGDKWDVCGGGVAGQ